MAEEPLSFQAFVEDELRRNPNQTAMNAKRKYKGYKADFLANQEALSKESDPDPVTTTQPSLLQQALDKEVEAKELMASGGDYMSAMREALALKVQAQQEAANPVTTQDPIDQGIGSAAVSEQGIPIEPPGLSILEKLKKDGGLPDPVTDPGYINPLIEPAIVNPILNPKPPNPQELKDKYSDLDPGFFDAPEFQDYLSAGNGIGTMDMYNSPYFGMGGSGSIGKAQDRAYEAYLDRIKSADAAPVVTDPVADMDPTQVDLPLVQEGPSEVMSFEDYKMSQPVSGLGPESDEAYRERYKKYVDFYNSGAPEFVPPQETPTVPGTEVVPANPTAPPTNSAPATPTPGVRSLGDGLGAQLRQLFQQYMGSRQQYPNNYSRPLVRPMDQYRTAVTDTDEYKAYNQYAQSLGPTEEQRAELQRLQSAFEGTDAYGQFNQQRQQRRNYMQPLGYGGGYGGGYGSGYGGGFQGGFGGYGGGYGGYQQPSYQQPYYQPPMQQQLYYGGGIMGGSSYGYPNNYSSYQQPYQQPYQMAQQYQQQPAYQSYGSVQPQYPTQYSSYASPFANSIR